MILNLQLDDSYRGDTERMKLRNKILIVFGFIFLLLGAIGVFFPILPTTPFVLLAAGCFASSKRLTDWLEKNKLFGEFLVSYRERNGLRKIIVIKSLSFLWITLVISIIYIHALWATILLPCIGIAVTTHILMIAKPKLKDSNRKS